MVFFQTYVRVYQRVHGLVFCPADQTSIKILLRNRPRLPTTMTKRPCHASPAVCWRKTSVQERTTGLAVGAISCGISLGIWGSFYQRRMHMLFEHDDYGLAWWDDNHILNMMINNGTMGLWWFWTSLFFRSAHFNHIFLRKQKGQHVSFGASLNTAGWTWQ